MGAWPAIAILMLLAGCASETASVPWPQEGQPITIEGVVIEVDREPTFVDGDAVVSIDATGYGWVTLLVPARIRLCRARGMELAASLQPGDRVRVIGEAVGRGRVSACRSTGHEVVRLTG